MKLIHKPRWYRARLSEYFKEHYLEVEDIAHYWPDPAINVWIFDIPHESGAVSRVRLTCKNDGKVEEETYYLRTP